jgi:hypothetical protein
MLYGFLHVLVKITARLKLCVSWRMQRGKGHFYTILTRWHQNQPPLMLALSSGHVSWQFPAELNRNHADCVCPVNDFGEIKKIDKKKMRLSFGHRNNSLPRRSTICSIDSVLSHSSALSKDPEINIMDRIKAIDCEFYDQEGIFYVRTQCRRADY